MQEEWMKKSELLSALQEAYGQWESLLTQIGPARMEQPGVNGDWSMKDVIAHLSGWNRRLVERLEAAQRGLAEPSPPWPAQLETEDEINAWIVESYRGRSLREVLDDTQQLNERLLAVVETLPADAEIERIERSEKIFYVAPVGDQRFHISEFLDHFRDDHESDVRAWLERVTQQ
jgi:hypothetical protein